MAATKIHFNDQSGSICSGRLLLDNDWKAVTERQLRQVTCKRCIKKLREIGFAMWGFESAIKGIVERTSAT